MKRPITADQMVRALEPELLHILQHSLGVDEHGRGSQYRNHYAVAPECDSFNDCQTLVKLGLMEDRGPIAAWGAMHYFGVTEAGKKAVAECSPMAPKLSRAKQRYQQFLFADSGLTFKEWLLRKRFV